MTLTDLYTIFNVWLMKVFIFLQNVSFVCEMEIKRFTYNQMKRCFSRFST